ncbi:hypothetical protein P692DRAFT_20740112 [Suillus brevipes Sb2]|nr:hypothetical protein P692DRAFT_20740112 [Suillus brevipes Sb2]
MTFSTLREHVVPPSRVFSAASFRSTTPIPSRPSTPKVSKTVSFSAEHVPQLSDPNQLSMYSSITSMDSNTSKITKPEGEAGRPGRGGYNLETALCWDALRFKQFKDSVHRSINKHCDTHKSKTHQTPTALIHVQNDVIVQFPELHDYQDYWPVGDVIQMQLKNLSAKERQKKK